MAASEVIDTLAPEADVSAPTVEAMSHAPALVLEYADIAAIDGEGVAFSVQVGADSVPSWVRL